MGMYDNVSCERPLPDGFEIAKGACFQSKDFGCEMDTYTITQDGRLTRRYVSDYEDVPETEWEYINPTGALEKIWHENSKRRPIYSTCDMNFQGWLNFYSATGRHRDNTWEWHEYRAKFMDGQLQEIMVIADGS